MNEVRCPRCGATSPPNVPFCGNCGTQLIVQQAPQTQPPPNPAYYAQPGLPPKVVGENTKWSLGLGVVSIFCCGPISGIPGVLLAKKDMDEIKAGRAPQFDEKWAQWAFYLNIAGLALFVFGFCLWWGFLGMHRF